MREFEKYDPEKIGKVYVTDVPAGSEPRLLGAVVAPDRYIGKEDFFSVLKKFDSHLKEESFNDFLKRRNLICNATDSSYLEFLWNLQDSDEGIKILSKSMHSLYGPSTWLR
ncbi:hypothetical protein PRBEI_2000395600 [Prionailurus iriomotensis]